MFAVDCWDLIQAPKHEKYSIKMYGCQGKWTTRIGDGLNDMLRANAFCTYKACNKGTSQVRCRDQYKFLSEALDEGFKQAVEELKQKKNGIHHDIQYCIQLSP
eukprot:6900489-Ditylum_brightwellii.AAC.1